MKFTEKDLNNSIKGVIAELIVERMFRELGFYVIRFGQEHAVNPITQLSDFVQKCGGKYYLNNVNSEEFEAFDMVKTLPDFLMVHPTKPPELVEVKFRSNGQVWEKDTEILQLFPLAFLLIVNYAPNEYTLKDTETGDEKLKKELLETRFHIHWYDEGDEDNEEEFSCSQTTLKNWLESTFDMTNPTPTIKKYEAIVKEWFASRKKQTIL